MFNDSNPCKRNAFDAYRLPPQETDLKNILSVLRDRRSDWHFRTGTIEARDAWKTSEAEMNGFEQQLLDPLSRLRLEQFAHQEHYFALDPDIERALGALGQRTFEGTNLSPTMLEQVRRGVVSKLVPLLPAPAPEPVEDKLPWPPRPGALPDHLESFGDTLFRDK